MLQTSLLATGHADLVTHVVYDFYGERLATCSADHKIKVFRQMPDGTWEPETEWKAHDAPILHLSFAHPIHGPLLASSSHDRTVRIWEEIPSPSAATGAPRWAERAVLTGAKGSVRAVEFSPPNPQYGLRVASIATDSHLRVHTSLDPELNDWSLVFDVHVPSLAAPHGEEAPAPSTPGDGPAAAEAATGGWGISWCKEKWWGSVIAVFSGTSPTAKIVTLDPFPKAAALLQVPGATSPLTAVAWAPSCGRSYHLIATGSRDGAVRIWQVQPPADEEGAPRSWTSEVVAEFPKGARIGMVEWNATGTTLTTSDDEGVIRIYKPTYAKNWKLLGKMTAEEPLGDE
ncbi:epoxide hydrolase, soluble (sEH) [Vanrija albida]|uniref:Epoxide hydrolase, soluble (SEH) n=1 Tax=Vanrija albida TaxID=181172 RepID=A0ABR3PY93_9TREE